MHELAMVLRTNRAADGAIELVLPEVKVELDKSGKVKGARLVEHTVSHQIIEELMLAANQAVATWLDDLKIAFLRRVHPAPDRRKLRKLTEFVRDLGIRVDNLEDRFEVQKVVQAVRGKPTEFAVNYAILKSMSKAIYQPELEQHYALRFDHYCHFTSPIRRYPDLQVHRTVDRLVRGIQPVADPLPVLVTLGHHCSDKEQNAEWAEREVIKIKMLHFLNKQIGQTMPGIISSVTPEGFYVRGTKFPAEGFVSIKNLPGDQYRYERRGQMLEGFRSGNRFRLGDELVVRIEEVDLARRALLLSIVSKQSSSRPSATKLKASGNRAGKRAQAAKRPTNKPFRKKKSNKKRR